MRRIFLSLIVLLLFAVSAFAQFDFPSSPTTGQQVTGPGGQVFQWDGTKWIAIGGGGGGGGGPFLPLTGGTLTGALNGTSASFSGNITGASANTTALTIGAGGTAVLGGNATTALQAVPLQQLNSSIAALGTGPFLPVNNPSFTGTLTGTGQGNITSTTGIVQFGNQLIVSLLDVQGGGNPQITFPDSSDWWTGGLAIATQTSSISSRVFWYAIPPGQPQSPPYLASIGAGTATLNIAQGARQTTGLWYADSANATTIQQNLQNISFTSNQSLTVGSTFTPTPIVTMTPVGMSIFPYMVSGTGTANQYFVNSAGSIVGTATSSAGNYVLASQAYEQNIGGTLQWVAQGTTAVLENLSSASGSIAFYSNSGLTVGSTFTPTIIATITPTNWKSGPWTPQVQFGGNTTGVTYQSGWPYGTYWRVGSHVFVSWGVWLASKGTATGGATMCGLPFHIPNDGHNYGPFMITNFGSLVAGGGTWLPTIQWGGNGQLCVNFGYANVAAGTAGNAGGLTDANFTGVDNIQGSFEYVTNDP